MTNNAPSGTKKHCKSIELESHQTAKMFFFDVEICRVGLYTELYYAYYVSMLFADLLSLHLVTFLCFFTLILLYSYTLIEDSIVSMLLRSTECTRALTMYQYIDILQY